MRTRSDEDETTSKEKRRSGTGCAIDASTRDSGCKLSRAWNFKREPVLERNTVSPFQLTCGG